MRRVLPPRAPCASLTATLALLSCVVALAGCGQKGPLTLPQTPVKPSAAASAPAR